MKFPLAQEVSRHVRDKVCKFYQTAPPCTVTSNEASTSFFSIADDSIKFQSLVDKVAVDDLIDQNFTELLSPSAFRLTPSNENEFEMIIDGLENEAKQVVEISFACKLCDFR